MAESNKEFGFPSWGQHERMAVALETIANNYDSSGMTTLEKTVCANFIASRTGRVWKRKIWHYDTNTTSAVVEADDYGMGAATPGTNLVEGSDPYLDYSVFQWEDCNYVRDDDGTARLTALKGMPGFKTSGAVDVGVISPTFWWKFERHDTYDMLYFSDSPNPALGLSPWVDAVKTDGTVLPYYIVSKYPSVLGDDNLWRSLPGKAPVWKISHNSMITNYQKKGTGYWGAGNSANTLQGIMLAVKYLTKNSQKYFRGHVDNNFQYVVAATESDVTRVLLTEEQAGKFEVNGVVLVGDSGDASTVPDRGAAVTINIADRVRIKSIEAVEVGGTTYYALNLDVSEAFSTTETTWVSSAPNYTGMTDEVLGHYDGSYVSNTNGHWGYRVKGIEYMLGQYIVAADTILKFEDVLGVSDVYVAPKGVAHTSAGPTSDYVRVGVMPTAGDGSTTNPDYYGGDYIMDETTGASWTSTVGGSNSTGTADRIWAGGTSAKNVAREYLMNAYLHDGSTAGVWTVNRHYALGPSYWYFSSRD